jgi:hypothetical protein
MITSRLDCGGMQDAHGQKAFEVLLKSYRCLRSASVAPIDVSQPVTLPCYITLLHYPMLHTVSHYPVSHPVTLPCVTYCVTCCVKHCVTHCHITLCHTLCHILLHYRLPRIALGTHIPIRFGKHLQVSIGLDQQHTHFPLLLPVFLVVSQFTQTCRYTHIQKYRCTCSHGFYLTAHINTHSHTHILTHKIFLCVMPTCSASSAAGGTSGLQGQTQAPSEIKKKSKKVCVSASVKVCCVCVYVRVYVLVYSRPFYLVQEPARTLLLCRCSTSFVAFIARLINIFLLPGPAPAHTCYNVLLHLAHLVPHICTFCTAPFLLHNEGWRVKTIYDERHVHKFGWAPLTSPPWNPPVRAPTLQTGYPVAPLLFLHSFACMFSFHKK